MTINRKFFFQNAKKILFDGTISVSQVAGCNAVLDAWEAGHKNDDDRWLAYMFGTAHHETGRAMWPIRETFAASDDQVISRLEKAFGAGKLTWVKAPYWRKDLQGMSWYGRGLVQITHRANYERLGALIGVNLSSNPNLALDIGVAVKIMFAGMMNGAFTGRKLADYFWEKKEDWRGARRIINGSERADLVASYAKAYYSCISYTTG